MRNPVAIQESMKQHDVTCPQCKKVMNAQPSLLMVLGHQLHGKTTCPYCNKVFSTQYKNGILSVASQDKKSINQGGFHDIDGITYVQQARLTEIIYNMKKKSSKGKFYTYDYNDGVFTAVDNSSGDAWTETFTDFEIMRKWLSGELEIAEVIDNEIN
jgi:uncharacterized Zn-finger protein